MWRSHQTYSHGEHHPFSYPIQNKCIVYTTYVLDIQHIICNICFAPTFITIAFDTANYAQHVLYYPTSQTRDRSGKEVENCMGFKSKHLFSYLSGTVTKLAMMARTSTIRRWTTNYHWLPAFSRSPAGPTAQHHC